MALTCNATQAQLVLYCQALGMCDKEMKCCHKSSPFMEYLRNCQDGSTWTAQPATQIQCLHHMKLNELLILCCCLYQHLLLFKTLCSGCCHKVGLISNILLQ